MDAPQQVLGVNMIEQIIPVCTGKSVSEALIHESVNPQYDNMCTKIVLVLTFKTIFVHKMLSTCIFLGIQ